MKHNTAYSYCDACDEALINEFPEDIESIYVGSYFCEKYFCGISEKQWDTVIQKAVKRHLIVVLVIPTPSQSYIHQIKTTVKKLMCRYAGIISEVVVNDFAMLKYISEYGNAKIWCGRTMSKDIRDPRYTAELHHSNLYDHIRCGETMDADITVYGVEIDPISPLSVVPFENVMLGIHTPMAYITFGRHCEIGSSELPLKDKFRVNKQCSRQCENNWLSYSDDEFIKYGRAVYCYNHIITGIIPDSASVRIIKNAIADKIGRK